MSIENRIEVRRTPEECYIHTKVNTCLTHRTPKSRNQGINGMTFSHSSGVQDCFYIFSIDIILRWSTVFFI